MRCNIFSRTIKKSFYLLAAIFFLASVVSARIDVAFNPEPVAAGEQVEIIIEASDTFYYKMNIYDENEQLIGEISVSGCQGYNQCKKETAVYQVPDTLSGRYSLKVYDYATNRWETSYFNVGATKSSCKLTRAHFSRENVKDNEIVQLIAEGTNCDGKNAEFIIKERDTFFSAEVARINAVFKNGKAIAEWTASWSDDNILPFVKGNPEYFFTIDSLDSENSLTVLPGGEWEIGGTISEDNGIQALNIDKQVNDLTISGSVTLESEDAIARVIMIDENGGEYLVYETFSLIADRNTFYFTNECEETCVLDSIRPVSFKVELEDAFIRIDEVQYSSAEGNKIIGAVVGLVTGNSAADSPGPHISEESMRIKKSKDAVKIDKLNRKLVEKGEKWRATETPISQLSYSEKKKLFYKEYGRLPNLKGYEYFEGLVSLDAAEKAADFFSKRRWPNSKVGPAKLATSFEGRPEAYFFLIYKPGADELTVEELGMRVSPDDMSMIDDYATVIIGAHEEREPFIASFGGVPLQMLMINEAIEKRRNEIGEEPGEPRMIWDPPYFITFQFPSEEDTGLAGAEEDKFFFVDGTELLEVKHGLNKTQIDKGLLQKRKNKWNKWK